MLGHRQERREATPMWWRRRYKRSDPGSDLRPVPARSGEGLDEGVAGASSGGGVGSATPRMEGVGGRGMGHGAWVWGGERRSGCPERQQMPRVGQPAPVGTSKGPRGRVPGWCLDTQRAGEEASGRQVPLEPPGHRCSASEAACLWGFCAAAPAGRGYT